MEFGASLKISSSIRPLCFSSLISDFRTLRKLSRLRQRTPSYSLPILRISPSKVCSCRASSNDTRILVETEIDRMPAEDLKVYDLSPLTALSPLDGRYWEDVNELAPFMSEYGLIRHRVQVEIKWLIKLSQIPEVVEVPRFSPETLCFLEGVIDGFSMDDAVEVKNIEKITNHDVKAVEYFLKQKCKFNPEIAEVLEFFHFACTSEDINNLAHALMLKGALKKVMFPAIDKLIKMICNMAKQYAHIPMLSRTHGQPASPTTLGKEMANFADRLIKERQNISQAALLGKFAGAVGNYNAHLVAYPSVDWPTIAEEFVNSLGLGFNPYVTQIEPHNYMSKLFNAFIQFNSTLKDFNIDMWGYISVGYFKQETKVGEIGSSTMPHKVNPIDFENSESNLGLSIEILSYLSKELLTSRFQRDLTDSTSLRNMGVVLGHCLYSYKRTLQGVAKLQVNEARLSEDLEQNWGVLAEPIQTVMRRFGVPEPYEKLKELTRGKEVAKESIRDFIEGLELPLEAKANLLKLTPHTYIGAAIQLAQKVVERLDC